MRQTLAALAALAMLAAGAMAHHSDEHAWMLDWIPHQCCVTNDCCFEIKSTDAVSLPDDQWMIVASGQVLKRTNWSPDGKYYRCACDSIDGKWVVHPTAYTRCIFPPMPMTERRIPLKGLAMTNEQIIAEGLKHGDVNITNTAPHVLNSALTMQAEGKVRVLNLGQANLPTLVVRAK